MTAPSAGHVTIGRVLRQFVVVGMLLMLLVGSGGLLAVHRIASSDEVERAQELTVATARELVEPAVTDPLVAGDPEALRKFDALMTASVLRGPVVRVKLWAPGGRIVYCDRRELEGDRFPLARDENATLRTGRPEAAMSPLDQPENQLERRYGSLVEVYTRVTTPTGTPLLFESYLLETSALAGNGGPVWSTLPAFIGCLVALLVLQVTLAWRLARRAHRSQRETAALQRRTLDVSDHERRRIVRDMHDGAIQSLAGVSYSVAGTADQMRAAGQPDTAARLDDAAAATRFAIAQLRSLVSDISPPAPPSDDLRASIVELLATVEKHGLRTSLDLAADPPVAADVAAALYRAVHEAVRNVIAHSRATKVHVALVQQPPMVGVVVDDNGVGPTAVPHDRAPGQHGLPLLGELAAEAGGRLTVAPGPDGGTRFTFLLPNR
jgi:two-component system NarL family sensor kinase